MEIGLAVPQLGRFADLGAIRRVAVEAEAAGFASLWAADRLLVPIAPRSPYPASPDGSLPEVQAVALDPLTTLTVAAAVTQRARLGTCVLVAPWYPPALLARSLASLDHLSSGRLTVGLGIGWSLDEYEAVGASMAHRGRRLEEVLDVLTVMWRDGVSQIETRYERVAPAKAVVKPVQRPAPPVLLAAFTPAGFDRIARRADGWVATGLPLDVLASTWATIREAAERAGRDAEALRLIMHAEPKIGRAPLGGDRAPFSGTRRQIAEDIERVRALGADELELDPQATARSTSEYLDLALELAADTFAYDR